jgi:hypothetical protein
MAALAAAVVPTAHSRAGATPLIRVETKAVASGAPYTLAVTVDGADSLAALRLLLTYHGERNAAESAPVAAGPPGDRHARSNPLVYPDTSGTTLVAWLSAVGVSGSDSLLTLSMRGLGAPGTSDTITVAALEALAADGSSVDVAVQPGIVTFTPRTTVPAEMPLPGLALRGMPSPGRGKVEILLSLPHPGPVRVELFDARGRRVRTLLDGAAGSGPTRLPWDGTTDSGARAGPGVYFVRASIRGNVATIRIVLVQ